VIELERIDKSYRCDAGAVAVLTHLSLRLNAGDYVAIGGESGAGKTTLLNILGCLDRADAGVVRFDDVDVTALADDDFATLRNRRIGFVFQTSHFVEHLDLADNVALPARYRDGVSPNSARQRAVELLGTLGLASRATHLPGELSGGERQRAAIARAMFPRPGLLLADEPTGNLDRRNADTICDCLARLNSAGVTIVLVTHDPRIAACAKAQFRLSDGTVVRQ
jgi:putative ABC transport system ATP-binding protein